MNKSFALPLLAIVFLACNGGSKTASIKPYKFDRNRLDKMVKSNAAMYDASKSPDGTLEYETYYLGDTAKYRINYDPQKNIREVIYFDEHGQIVWQEMYHPNGQRRSHYNLKAFEAIGPKSVFHGVYEEYYPDGRLKATGVYNQNVLAWSLEYDKEGNPSDTTIYDYAEAAPDAEPAEPAKVEKPKVEKIKSATSPN